MAEVHRVTLVVGISSSQFIGIHEIGSCSGSSEGSSPSLYHKRDHTGDGAARFQIIDLLPRGPSLHLLRSLTYWIDKQSFGFLVAGTRRQQLRSSFRLHNGD